MPNLPREQVERLEYVQHVPADGRFVPLRIYFDSAYGEWRAPLDRAEELLLVDVEAVVTGSYIAHEPDDPARDFHVSLGTLVLQHASFGECLDGLGKIENSVHRCAAVLEKYHAIWRGRAEWNGSAPLLVTSELEYLLFILRSSYDHLQRIARRILGGSTLLKNRDAE